MQQIMQLIEQIAHNTPVGIFVPIASFVEEVIAPIPSPIVMVLSGSLANAQNQPLYYLGLLSVLGSIGKTFGAWLLYIISDKLEDIVSGKLGKFLGVSHKDIENIGNKLNGGWKDNVFLFFARALPVIPSAPVSVACGIIKVNMRTFLTTTFAGTIVRNLMYLYLGYAGLGNYKQIADGFEKGESIGQIILLVVIAGVIGWAYYKRGKNSINQTSSNLESNNTSNKLN